MCSACVRLHVEGTVCGACTKPNAGRACVVGLGARGRLCRTLSGACVPLRAPPCPPLGARRVLQASNHTRPSSLWFPGPAPVAELCEAFAARKSWKSRRGGRLDAYRAANAILRMALAGRPVVLAFYTPS